MKKRKYFNRLKVRGCRSYKRTLASALLFLMSFNFIVGCFGTVGYASSGERISAFINLASGKQSTDTDINKLNLSKKDLQFLGVYISNFFVPFGTELGVSGEGSEGVTSSNKETIKKALQTNLNFSDTMAETLTETILGLSRGSVQELELVVSKEYQKGLVPVPDMPLNYYTALSSVLGGLGKIVGMYKDKNTVIKDIAKGKYEYGYFAYMKNGKYVPVFDFDLDMSTITPSVASFIKALESLDIENGYGFNFFDFTKNEVGVNESSFKELVDKLDKNQAYKMSAYGSKLSVDAFGNIILMGANHQFIAVPACMNPYVWVEVDSTGKEIGEGLGGTAYNMVNIPSMALNDNISAEVTSNRLFSWVANGQGVIETKVLADKLKKVADNPGKGTYALRILRGDREGSLAGIWDIFKGSSFRDLAIMAMEGFKEANPKAKNYYNIKDGVFVNTKYVNVFGAPVTGDQLSGDRNVKVLDSFAYTDNLGAAHFDDSGEKVDFSTFNIESYLNGSERLLPLKQSLGTWGSSPESGFTNTFSSIKNGDIIVPSTVSREAMVGLYVTYAYSSLYDNSSADAKKSTIGKLGYKMNNNSFPEIPNEPLMLSEGAKSDLMLTSIRDWTYYLLHPTEGIKYFATLVTNKLNGFLLSWHDSMVGTNGTGSINGTTNYRGNSGYVTSPELSDIPWADSLMKFYQNSIPFLLVIMIVIMLGAYVTGALTFQKSVIGFLIFCITAQLPIGLINGVVGTSNRFSSNLYGEKFSYWALVQHESYSDAIDEAASGDSYSNYLKTLYETNAKSTGNQGKESIMLKWQAPKKMSSLMFTKDEKDSLGGFDANSMLGGLINKTYSGENYLDDKDSVYLYRSYIDIANFSRYIHRGLEGSDPKQPVNLSLTSDVKRTWNDSLKSAIADYDRKYEADRSLGYANKNGDGSSSGTGKDILRVRLPLSSSIVTEAYGNTDLKNLTLGDYVGINQDAFNFSIPMFNVDSLDYYEELRTDTFNPERYTREDFSGLAAYGLMSENPFYYFSWYLYESGLSSDSSNNTGYKNLLLGEDNGGFFYNTKGNGELKDFVDMRSLFTYIIPYLKQGNDIVDEWDKMHGVFIYDGVPTEEGHQDDAEIKNNKELQQKYWHNLNVARLYNIYSPWVDVMYDSSYAKSEKIKYLGESYVVQDPINPASYPEERPMIFSKSEMVDYGLKESQLTKVERLILDAQEGMQERMFKLLNYYSFNDVVLNTATAMNLAFEFNNTFSENSLFGNNNNIYPQAFELNDFSYDAFLRFILANSTGESMLVDGNNSFYGNIIEKSSTTTIIVMLILDFISIYVLPGLKIFFIMGMFIMSILLILMSAFRVDPEFKFVKKLGKNLISPMFRFLLINCGMAFVLSLFMGEGNDAVTGSMKPTISLGDPVMVMLAMVLLNGVVLFLLFKLLMEVWKNIKSSGKMVVDFISGVAGSAGGLALATAVGKSNMSSGSSDMGASFSTRMESKGNTVYVESNRGNIPRKTKLSKRDIKRLDKYHKKSSKKNSKNVTYSPSNIDSKINTGLGKLKKNSKKS